MRVLLDWLPLAARMGVLFLFGLLLLLPPVTRDTSRWRRHGLLGVVVVLVAFTLVAVASWLGDPHARRERPYEHIKEGHEQHGKSEKAAEEIAAQ